MEEEPISLSVRFEDDLLSELDVIASALFVSRAAAISLALKAGMNDPRTAETLKETTTKKNLREKDAK